MEPITTAFAALGVVKQIVGLVKESCKTIDDVSSLGPMLGKYFDSKQKITKHYQKAQQRSFEGSNMAYAMEIELELDKMKEFERQVQMMFFQANKIDVWNKILNRAATMEKDSKVKQRTRNVEAKKRKERAKLILAILIMVVLLSLSGYSIYEAYSFCQISGCGY
jgi:hypothetical protein